MTHKGLFSHTGAHYPVYAAKDISVSLECDGERQAEGETEGERKGVRETKSKKSRKEQERETNGSEDEGGEVRGR